MRRACVLLLIAGVLAACGDGSSGARDPKTTLQLRDASTGSVRWSVALKPDADATEPVLAGKVVLVAEPGGDAVAFSVTDGHEVWRVPGALPEGVSGDLVVFDYEDRIEARRPADGRLVWRRMGHEDMVRSRSGGQLVVVDDGRPVAQTVDCGGTSPVPCVAVDPSEKPRPASASLVDPRNGRARWTTPLAATTSAFHGGVTAHHVLLELAGQRGVVALDLADGRRVWSSATDSLVGIATTDEQVAVRSGGRQVVRDASSGRVLWSVDDDAMPSESRPFIGASAGEAFLRDPRSGRELPGRVAFAYGVVRHADLLVGATGETLTAARAGRQAWTSPLLAGERPVTYLDADDTYVVSVTATGQEPSRD